MSLEPLFAEAVMPVARTIMASVARLAGDLRLWEAVLLVGGGGTLFEPVFAAEFGLPRAGMTRRKRPLAADDALWEHLAEFRDQSKEAARLMRAGLRGAVSTRSELRQQSSHRCHRHRPGSGLSLMQMRSTQGGMMKTSPI